MSTSSQRRWMDGDLRELSVVLDLVLEIAELFDNLLALSLLFRVVGLGDGAVNVVDGARLGHGTC